MILHLVRHYNSHVQCVRCVWFVEIHDRELTLDHIFEFRKRGVFVEAGESSLIVSLERGP